MLTPVQIKSYRFQSAGRGLYKADEVDQFFEKVSASYEHIFRENGELVKRVSLMAEKIEEYRRDEELIKKTLIVAQRKADELENEAAEASRRRLADAEREAAEKLSSAQERADGIVRSAEATASQRMAAATGKAELLKMNAEETAAARLVQAQTQVDALLGGLQKELAEEKEALKRVRYESKFFRKKLTETYREQLERVEQLLGFIDGEIPAEAEIPTQAADEAKPSEAPAPKPAVHEPPAAAPANVADRLQAVLSKEQQPAAAARHEPPESAGAADAPVFKEEAAAPEPKSAPETDPEPESKPAPAPVTEPEPEEDDGDVFIYGGDDDGGGDAEESGEDGGEDGGGDTYGVVWTPHAKTVDELVNKYAAAENGGDGFDTAAEELVSASGEVSEEGAQTADDGDDEDDGEGFRISLEQFVAEAEDEEPAESGATVESRLRKSFFGRRSGGDENDEEDDEDEYDEDEYDDEDDDDDDEEDDDGRPRRFKGFFKK